MKVIYFFIFSSFLLFQFLSAEAQHSWTDLQGRTLQASFIKSDGVTLTIKWNGKIVPIPLETLSPQSQALAKQLSTESSSANPFDSIAPTPSRIAFILGLIIKDEHCRLLLLKQMQSQ